VLTDARMRQDYALAYRAKVEATYEAAEESTGPEQPADQEEPADQQERTESEEPVARPDSIYDASDMPVVYPADYVPWTGPQRTVERAEALDEWLMATNPDKSGAGRWNNCGECARAVAKTWFGEAVTAAALADDEAAGEPTRLMSDWAGQAPAQASMTEISRRLESLGAGSLAIVGFDRSSGAGHWFNAVNRDGTVLAVDGQVGRFGEWPPRSLNASFDESEMQRSEAIFFTPDGKVVRDDH
jgi:CubicO group peptidase (beta-lactamase class C family)